MTRRARRPKLYRDPPGTRVLETNSGWEIAVRPDRRMTLRRQLSRRGVRRHERLEILGQLGWQVISLRGVGSLTHPDRRGVYTIAAAWHTERLEGGR